jgi:hypothetical protein
MKTLVALCAAALIGASLAPRPAAAQAPSARPARGMEFGTFIKLDKGMTESELMLRAGPADAVGHGERGVVYYYFPTVADPFLTTVTVRQGRIVNLERERKTF